MKNGSANGGKVDILLVEDNAADLTLILNVLKKATICNRVFTLSEGAQIMDCLLRTGPFSGEPPLAAETLILLSLNLKDMHGLDVLRKIKGDARSKSFPVIIMTSSQEERGVMKSYKLGANACIVKPFDLVKLMDAVSELRLGWLLISREETNGR